MLAVIMLVLSSAVYAQKAICVKFAGKSASAIVSGNLNGYKSKKVFVVKVREGKTLNVEQIKKEASAHYVSISIKSPSGEDATDSDASCKNRKEIAPTEAGDYTMTVYECQKADAWRGAFRVKISVK